MGWYLQGCSAFSGYLCVYDGIYLRRRHFYPIERRYITCTINNIKYNKKAALKGGFFIAATSAGLLFLFLQLFSTNNIINTEQKRFVSSLMEVQLTNRKNIDPLTWDRFIEASPQGMIYSCYAYMTAIDPDWQAIIIKKSDTIQAAMPFTVKAKAGIQYSLQPIFTQYWGVLFRPMDTTVSREFELKKQLVKLIVEN